MNAYRCKYKYLSPEGRAVIIMIDPHKGMGGDEGEVTITSKVKTIDFANGVMVTQNSVYLFEPN